MEGEAEAAVRSRQEDAEMPGASAVVVQKLIQRGKDKCRLIEMVDGQTSKEALAWSRLLHPTA